MSAKSTAHPTPRHRFLFSRTTIVVALIAVAFIFFATVVKYPLIFGPEKTESAAPTPPATEVH